MAVKGNTGWASAMVWGDAPVVVATFLDLRTAVDLGGVTCAAPTRAADVDEEGIENVSSRRGFEGYCSEHTLKASSKASHQARLAGINDEQVAV